MIFFACSLNFAEYPSSRLALRFAFLLCFFILFDMFLYGSFQCSSVLFFNLLPSLLFVQKIHNIMLNVVNFENFG